MNPDGTEFDDVDELELLRRDARAIGMPGPLTPASAGISAPQTADDILARIRARTRSRRRRMRARILVLAATVTTVLTLIVAPWQQPPATADAPPVLDFEFANAQNIAYAPGEDARAALLSLARTAAAQPPLTRNGSTQYQLSDNWYASLSDTEEAQLIPTRSEFWVRPDGSMRIRETTGKPLSPDGRGLTAQPTTAPRVRDDTFPPSDIPASFVDDLYRDERKIRASLLDYKQCPVTSRVDETSCLYQEISSLHDQFVIPPDISAYFWQILAEEPSVRLLGSVTDRAGRPGIGISLIPSGSPQFRIVMIISSETGQLLGTEDILIKDDLDFGVKAPAIYSFTAILKSEYTAATGPKD